MKFVTLTDTSDARVIVVVDNIAYVRDMGDYTVIFFAVARADVQNLLSSLAIKEPYDEVLQRITIAR